MRTGAARTYSVDALKPAVLSGVEPGQRVVTSAQFLLDSEAGVLLVADGMGAHAAGELASKLAVDNIPHTYFKLRDLYPPAALRQAIRDANTVIHNKGQSSIGFQGMGTTCSSTPCSTVERRMVISSCSPVGP